MMTAVEGMYGGLNALADLLQIDRIGPVHQAGSDSLLTAQTFFSLINKHLAGVCDDSKFRGELFGLGTNHTKYKGKSYSNNGSNGNGSSAGTSIQYYNNVHYPPQHSGLSGSTAYGYQEEYQDMYN